MTSLVDVGLAELVTGEGGATARAVGDHLDVLVEEALVVEVLRFHQTDSMNRGKGPVGVVEVDPVADALGQHLPVVDVVAHRLAAQTGELGDAHLVLDLLLGGEAELLFDLDLDGEPVGVPPGLAGDGKPPHGAVAAEEVLVDAGPHVVESGPAVGRGRALVEDPRLGAGPQGDGAREDPCWPTGRAPRSRGRGSRRRREPPGTRGLSPPSAARSRRSWIIGGAAGVRRPPRSEGRHQRRV